MKKKFGSNRQGSVLLAVVCMTLVCMALATMTLATVNATMQASNQNVQKTQAKVTAEKVLTEFMGHYVPKSDGVENADGDLIPPTGKEFYDDLAALAEGHNETNPYVIGISMEGDTDFESNYGDVSLNLYKQGSYIKVKSTCTFGRKTETASICFKKTPILTNIPSNTLSANSGGNLISGIASPVDGDIYLEKDPSATYSWIGVTNGGKYRSHIYSEYNFLFNTTGASMNDVTNKNFAKDVNEIDPTDPLQDRYYYHDTDYFQQAPTLTVDGYISSANNNTKIQTTVGKTNIYRKNSDDYANVEEYNKSELSNKDGYVYAKKKLLLSMNTLKIGSEGRPIDMYSHGAYFGEIPYSINGNTNNDEKAVIYEGFKDSPFIMQGGGGCTDDNFGFYGNFYSYTGDQPYFQNGDVVIDIGNNSGPIIHGDCYIEGDLYLLNSSITVTGSLYVKGKIYYGKNSGSVVETTGVAQISGGKIVDITPSSDLNGRTFPNDFIKVSGIDPETGAQRADTEKYGTSINPNKQRNKLPEDGYDPAQNVTDSKRKGLNMYKESSPNQMFHDSAYDATMTKEDGTVVDLKEAAMEISDKYAEAMGNTLATSGVAEDYDGDNTIKIVKKSVRLTPDEVTGDTTHKYYIKLTDSDIVICLPIGDDLNYAKYRIDRSEVPDGQTHYVYFMFYDPNDLNKCYYLKPEDAVNKYHYTVPAADDNPIINIYQRNNQKMIIADTAPILKMHSGLSIPQLFEEPTENDFENSGEKTEYGKCFTDSGIQNYSMILLPDNSKYIFKSGNGPIVIESLLYGPNADVEFIGSNTIWFGKVNCRSFKCPNDIKSGMIQEVREAEGSVLNHVKAKNASDDSEGELTIQYYEY